MYKLITEISQIGSFLKELQEVSFLCLDTETTGLDCFKDQLILLQVKAKNIFIFDCRKLNKKDIQYIIQLVKDSKKQVIGHNLKFDLKFIYTNIGELLTNVYDTMIAEGVLVNGIGERFSSLADLVKKYLAIDLDKTARVEFEKIGENELTEQQLLYSALDVNYLPEIYKKQAEQFGKQAPVIDLEMRLLPVIASMELEGVLIDVNHWRALINNAQEKLFALQEELVSQIETTLFDNIDKILQEKRKRKKELDEILAKIHLGGVYESDEKLNAKTLSMNYIAFGDKVTVLDVLLFIGVTVTNSAAFLYSQLTDAASIKTAFRKFFNLSSPQQLKEVLKKLFGVEVDDTNEKTLSKITNSEIIQKVLAYREQAKKISSFGENFLENINPVTGRLHTRYEQLGMVSGRISSSAINLQNLPREQEYRKGFIARKGYKLISIDFSQEELRLMAVIMRVSKMLDAFRQGIDLHVKTASEIFGVPFDQVTKEQRSKGKSANFAVGYGSTEYGLYTTFGIPLAEGREILNKFYNIAYPEIRDFKQVVGDKIWSLGYSTTMLGRRRFFKKPNIFTSTKEMEKYKAKTLRDCINHIIQGTGADIIKESLVRIFYENPFGEKLKILMQVYDEIVCEAAEEIAEDALAFISKIMLETEGKYLKGMIPPMVDGKIADYWVH